MTPETRYIEQLFTDNALVELRCRHAVSGKWVTGIFDSPTRFADAARLAVPDHNVYCTLNQLCEMPATSLIAPAAPGSAISDSQIQLITRLPFDLDPVRPSGECSTGDELQHAIDQGTAMRRYFAEWPSPLVGSSGNGVHIQYRCRLVNTPATREMLKLLYLGLRARFSTDAVSFDATVRNPSRIFRLYGSVNRKGPSTAERPHRITSCVVPQDWRSVSAGQIFRLAETLRPKVEPIKTPTRPPTRSFAGQDYRQLDLIALFQSNGLYKRPLSSGKHAVVCPWSAEHSTPDDPRGSDSVIWIASASGSGYPSFFCSHGHCEGRGLFECIARLGAEVLRHG